MSSLRKKTILTTRFSYIALVLIAALVYVNLHSLQKGIVESEVVHLLQTSFQLVRNYEENMLLRDDPALHNKLNDQVDRTHELIERLRPSLVSFVEREELDTLNLGLKKYGGILNKLQNLDIPQNTKLELADLSESLLLQVTELGIMHQKQLNGVVLFVSWTLATTLIIAIIMGILSAWFVLQKIIHPINILEKQLDAVADEKMNKLTLTSNDEEIKSFVQHFNSMLDKQRTQQTQLRHHEKAAALGVLVSGVAHELNNPLSNISTSVQLLLEDDDTNPELQKQWLEHVDSETERSRRIVHRLLDSVRHQTLNTQPVSAASLVRSSILLIHRQLDPSLLLDIENIPETKIEMDKERFQQVFINLIRNASDAGAGNIQVTGQATTWEMSHPDQIDHVVGDIESIRNTNNCLLFTITDDGPGIPEENLPKLFTPFFSTKSKGEGTGLGLYLVEEIVDEHNGCIDVENIMTGGTRFHIWLPMISGEQM